MRYFHVVIFVIGTLQLQPSKGDAGKAVEALGKAKDVLSKGGKMSVLSNVLKYGQTAAFLGTAIKEVISIIQSFGPGNQDSKELKYLKEQFAIVNTKLDSLDHDFEEVKNLIDWNSMKINVAEYESTINALFQKFQIYLEAPQSTKKLFSDAFKNDYHYNFNDAPIKIYLILVSEGNIFQENVFKVVRKFFKNDSKRVAEFAAYMLRLIQKGTYLNIAFLKLDGQEARLTAMEKEWEERYEELKKIAKKVDKELFDAWSTQYRKDADEFSVRNVNLNNTGMATKLHQMLTEKYPWRQWFVLVYTFTDNSDKDRFYDNCDGFVKVNVGKKVVLINSISTDKKEPRISLVSFYRAFGTLQGIWNPYAVIAKRLFEMVKSNCEFYTSRGVVEAKAESVIIAPRNHFYVKTVKVLRVAHKFKNYEMFVFD